MARTCTVDTTTLTREGAHSIQQREQIRPLDAVLSASLLNVKGRYPQVTVCSESDFDQAL